MYTIMSKISFAVTLAIILSASLCFLPVIFGLTLDIELLDLEKLSSINVIGSFMISFGVTIPLLLEMLLEVIYPLSIIQFDVFIPNREIILALAVPDIIILGWIMPTKQYEILACLIGFRDVLLVYAFMLYMHKIYPNTWSFGSVIFIGVAMTGCNVLITYSVFMSKLQFSNLQTIMSVILGIVFVVFFTCCYRWYINISSSPTYSSDTSALVCTTCTIFFSLFFCADWLPTFYQDRPASWQQLGSDFVTMYSYMMAICTISVIVINSRVAKLETMRTKEQFLRYYAHEIRNPLNIVRLGINYIRKELSVTLANNSLCLGTLDDMGTSIDSVLRVLEDMGVYDSLLSGRRQLILSKVSPLKFIRDTIRLYQIQAMQLGISLRVSTDYVPSTLDLQYFVEADVRSLSLVLGDVLGNALKFTSYGGDVQVRLSVKQESDSGGDVENFLNRSSHGIAPVPEGALPDTLRAIVIEVVDNGIGISKENQARLFRDMAQFKNGQDHCFGGCGLGMYISKQILDRLGGKISVHSLGEGLGATFAVELPLVPRTVRLLTSESDALRRRSSGLSVFAESFRHPSLLVTARQLSSSALDSLTRGSRSGSIALGRAQSLENLFSLSSMVNTHRHRPSGSTIVLQDSFDNRRSSARGESQTLFSPNCELGDNSSRSLAVTSTMVAGGRSDDEEPRGIFVRHPTEHLRSSGSVSPNREVAEAKSREEPWSGHRVSGNRYSSRGDDTLCDGVRRFSDFSGYFRTHHILEGLPEGYEPASSDSCASEAEDEEEDEVKIIDLEGPVDRIASPKVTPDSHAATGYLSAAVRNSIDANMAGLGEVEDDSGPPALIPPSVLLIEDSMTTRKMMMRMLRNRFSSGVEAVHGKDGVSVVSQYLQRGEHFDLVLCDFSMPVMNGPTAVREIRRLGYEGLILGVTGNSLPADVATFLAAGANQVLLKPLDLDLLDEAISERILH